MFGNGNARNGYALFILVLFALLAVAGRIIFPSPLKIVQADNWVVMIDGHGVDQPCYYTLDELQKMTAGRVEKTYFTINNVGTERHTDIVGISMDYLLKQSGVTPTAKSITISSQDGYYRSYNLADVRRDYLDQTDPSARLPMALAWQEDGRDLIGAYPLKLVIGQTGEGDVNRPHWVRAVKTVTVNTVYVESGEGTPGAFDPQQGTQKPAPPQQPSAPPQNDAGAGTGGGSKTEKTDKKEAPLPAPSAISPQQPAVSEPAEATAEDKADQTGENTDNQASVREDENSLNENETGSLSLESGKDGRNPTWLVVFSVLLGLAAAGGGYLLYRKIKKR